jgi:hypothetical protein
MTWITVGSGLNLAWRMRARAKARDEAFWNRCLRDTVNWIDIYSRYDPVPQGPAPEAMVARVIGAEPRPYVSIRTANHDWPLSDHGAYWDNLEEAMSRIVHAITDSRLGSQPLDAHDGSFAPRTGAESARGAHPLTAGVRHAVATAGARRARVTTTWLTGIVLFAVVAVSLFAGSASLGAWVLGAQESLVGLNWPPLAWRRAFDDLVPNGLGPITFGSLRSPLTGAAILVLVAYVLAIISRLLVHWWSWSRPETTDPPEIPSRISDRAETAATLTSDIA